MYQITIEPPCFLDDKEYVSDCLECVGENRPDVFDDCADFPLTTEHYGDESYACSSDSDSSSESEGFSFYRDTRIPDSQVNIMKNYQLKTYQMKTLFSRIQRRICSMQTRVSKINKITDDQTFKYRSSQIPTPHTVLRHGVKHTAL